MFTADKSGAVPFVYLLVGLEFLFFFFFFFLNLFAICGLTQHSIKERRDSRVICEIVDKHVRLPPLTLFAFFGVWVPPLPSNFRRIATRISASSQTQRTLVEMLRTGGTFARTLSSFASVSGDI